MLNLILLRKPRNSLVKIAKNVQLRRYFNIKLYNKGATKSIEAVSLSLRMAAWTLFHIFSLYTFGHP